MFYLIPFMLTLLVHANVKVIYGEDNRSDVYAVTNSLYKTISLSTAALIDDSHLYPQGNMVEIRGRALGEMFQLCPDERFRFQPSAATCSGTLVAPDIIMTAGHCYDLAHDTCKNYAWIFDYKVAKENQMSVRVPLSSVYRCKEVLSTVDNKTADYSLIRLNRAVSDRSPIKLSQRKVNIQDSLVLIGHPLGLPTKIADNGFVINTTEFSFSTNLDAFTINSGSGVFDAMTGEVVGILSSGATDHQSQNGCTKSRVLSMEEGKEKVMKLDQVTLQMEQL